MSVLRPGVVHFKLIIDSRPGSSIGLFGSSVYLRTRTSTEGLQGTLVIVNSVLSPICLLMRGVHYSACSLCYKKNRPVSPKMFTNERLFTIQAFTITRVHCKWFGLPESFFR